MGRAKGTGRKKIEMKKIEKQSSLKVTFSKRRQGLFKKASELCGLYQVDIAIIVFSPGGRLYSFGHPSCDSVVNRFLEEQEEEQEGGFWWEESIEDLDMEELHKYELILEELRNNVKSKLEEMVLRRTCERDFFRSI